MENTSYLDNFNELSLMSKTKTNPSEIITVTLSKAVMIMIFILIQTDMVLCSNFETIIITLFLIF